MSKKKNLKNKEFMLTDGCMWERNKIEGKTDPHAIEVVDIETGQVRYIKGGSIIKLVEGTITEERTQAQYNQTG